MMKKYKQQVKTVMVEWLKIIVLMEHQQKEDIIIIIVVVIIYFAQNINSKRH